MKTILKIVGAVLLVALVGLGAMAAWIRSQMPVNGAARIEAQPGVVGVLSAYSYAWIIKTEHGAVLVDAGVETDAAAILRELSALGMTADQVHTVLMTHGHNDHFGGLGMFPNARVLIGEGDGAYLRGEKTTMPKFMLPKVNVPANVEELSGDSTLTLDGAEIRAISIPGHTAGSLAYLYKNVLFTGDSLMQREGKLQLGPTFFCDDAGENARSITRLEGLAFDLVADGHAGLTADAKPKLQAFVAR
jgi:hydroxyacylglutathione hydrolase